MVTAERKQSDKRHQINKFSSPGLGSEEIYQVGNPGKELIVRDVECLSSGRSYFRDVTWHTGGSFVVRELGPGNDKIVESPASGQAHFHEPHFS